VTADVRAAVDAAFRDEWGRILASVIPVAGDWSLAEECTQDAFARALERWPRDGVPDRPGAWLTTTARRIAIDRLRRAAVGAAKEQERAVDDTLDVDLDDHPFPDERLRLLFTCCHPALALEAQVALALRTLIGLTTTEIAHAFLVPEPTMAKRLVRAKTKIRHAGIPYRVPPAHLLPERTAGVLGVIYLLFNEGYAATAGDELVRTDLSAEAIRLGRVLVDLMPDEPEASGLLALMLLQDSRRAARTDDHGDLVPLDEQDRARWDAAAIAEGTAILEVALRRGPAGRYLVQAAIAACHATAPSASATDWPQIAGLYRALHRLQPTSIVALNGAVAVAMADGPDAGLRQIEDLEVDLGSFHLFHATRADLLRRADRPAEAAVAYERALALAPTDPERRYLRRRLAETRG
jgi:RNA polymerase sigma-70 factor (ECF subfamily)